MPLGLGWRTRFPRSDQRLHRRQRLGYNLAGDYPNNLPETHLVSTAIDCSSLSRTSLKFWRWLNVEQPAYDQAKISVSNDGSNWTTVWSNGGEIIEDQTGSSMGVDISAVADGQATVYLRWTMGQTNQNRQILGLEHRRRGDLGPEFRFGHAGSPRFVMQLGNYPNPFNPLTKIEFTLEQAGPVRVSVFDVQGRLVRSLVERNLPAGTHGVVWDGIDQGGRKGQQRSLLRPAGSCGSDSGAQDASVEIA